MAVMTGDDVLAKVPRQRQHVVAVRSDPLASPLSLMVLEPPGRPAAADPVPLARLLPIQRDRTMRRRSGARAMLGLAVACGFAGVLLLLIAGSAIALGRTL
jgi:hypothetical protein